MSLTIPQVTDLWAIPAGTKCESCKARYAKVWWVVRGQKWPGCGLCVAEAQLKHAREQAAKVPRLEREVRLMEQFEERGFWVYCKACGWQTQDPNAAVASSTCPMNDCGRLHTLYFKPSDWEKFGEQILADSFSCRDVEGLAKEEKK